jgi:type I restriction enzyme S subunit
MQQLLTGKKRLKGYNGDWKEMQLGDFIIESRIPSINNDVNRRITVKLNLKGIEKRDVRGSEAEDATYYFIRKKNQFIYGKQNLHKGAFGIIPDELDGFESSQDIPTFDFQNGVSPIYFMFFMSQEGFYQSLEKISTGTGSKRIHPENLYKVKVKFPSLEEQTAIAHVLEAAEKEISLLKAKVEKLREQKKGLMQVLLTGKVRLNNIKKY